MHCCVLILAILSVLSFESCIAKSSSFDPIRLHRKLNLRVQSPPLIASQSPISNHESLERKFPFKNGNLTRRSFLAEKAGYVMGLGAMFVYSPIIWKLLQSKENIDKLSLSTWLFNVLGLSLSVAYPAKKNFPIISYVELLAALSQSVVILMIISVHRDHLLSVTIYLVCVLMLFSIFLRNGPSSQSFLNFIQIGASLISNYSNIPQIMMTFRTKTTSWSAISAAMSMVGCFIRMLTSLELTKDPVLFGGYALGFFTNAVLLTQTILYSK